MNIEFWKYQGTGNDFIIIDNRDSKFDVSNIKLIKHLCNRKFGIGSDGFILIENHKDLDFNMIFFNPDGSQSFCGNGSRAAVRFANERGICGEYTEFLSTDGPHSAKVSEEVISLKMSNVSSVKTMDKAVFIDTGSPHHVEFVDEVKEVSLKEVGAGIRYSDIYKDINGTNVNFVENNQNEIAVRTYERGVEDETLSCGTGVTACALAANYKWNLESPIKVKSKGGTLTVDFIENSEGYSSIWLTGPAKFIFKGEINV